MCAAGSNCTFGATVSLGSKSQGSRQKEAGNYEFFSHVLVLSIPSMPLCFMLVDTPLVNFAIKFASFGTFNNLAFACGVRSPGRANATSRLGRGAYRLSHLRRQVAWAGECNRCVKNFLAGDVQDCVSFRRILFQHLSFAPAALVTIDSGAIECKALAFSDQYARDGSQHRRGAGGAGGCETLGVDRWGFENSINVEGLRTVEELLSGPAPLRAVIARSGRRSFRRSTRQM
jgi:hypothetical protein